MGTARTGTGKPAGIATALAAMLLLGGCSASPTSTYVDSNGREVTVDWRGYPGHAYTDADEVLSAPAREETEPLAKVLLDEVESALSSEYGMDWKTDGEAGWSPEGGNGYGGESAYLIYNSAGRRSDSAPPSPQDWRRIIDIVNDVAGAHGFHAVELDHESSPNGDEEAWQQELHDRFGTDDPDGYWAWNGTALAKSQWLYINLVDASRDPSGQAAAAVQEFGWAPQSIGIGYGATVLPENSIEAFRRDLAPFAGLEKPEPTTSD
jgi:hypothetical protein